MNKALDVPALLRHYGLRPQKKLGQNFLVDETALLQVVQAAQIQPAQTALEIGPGLGSLTRLLAEAAARVVCVELDGNLIQPLEEILGGYPNVEIIHGDILRLDPGKLMKDDPAYIVVANIPYYITSSLIRHLIENARPPEALVLTVQAEVAERICAKPGDLSLLALSVQVYGAPEIVARIPASAFYPSPQVDSAVIRVLLHSQPLIPAEQIQSFFRLAKAGFSQKRKTLRNALAAGMRWSPTETETLLRRVDIDPMRRAETLNLEEWKRLVALTSGLEP